MSARILVVDDSPTIRKIVAAILESRAYRPVLAADGQEALEVLEREDVDLVLLDFVMPRMNGYQFCRELRKSPLHRALPVVLMSAKGDKIRGQFVQQTGAVDAITKPFDARGLVAVIEGALKKHEEGRARPVPDAESMPEEELVSEVARPSRIVHSDPGVRRQYATSELTRALQDLLLPELQQALAAHSPGLTEGDLRPAFERAINPEALSALSVLMKTLDEKTREALSGDIAVISIAEVLQLLDLQRQTGALSISSQQQEVTLYIRQGHIDFASSRGLRDEFLLGRCLLDDRALSREELQRALDRQNETPELLGELLVESGVLGEEALRRALVRQTSELVYEVVRWQRGRFAFRVNVDQPPASRARLDLEVSALVMEGFRRVDEWRLIEGSFDFDEVLFPDPLAIERTIREGRLTAQERAVLEAIDGGRTVREIVDAVDGSSFELCKVLYQFLNSRLVRRRLP